jgi:hypothetical protein
MYQENIKYSNYTDNIPEEQKESEFNKLCKIVKETIGITDTLDKDTREYDLTKQYIPNWACIWNKIDNINRPCNIVLKNDELAMVVFEKSEKVRLELFYRLEDLSILE